MLSFNRKESIARLSKVALCILTRNRHFAPAQRVLDGDFPDGCCANPDSSLGRLNHFARLLRQLWAIRDGPKRNIRVEQQIQVVTPPVNSLATSSLCASILSGTSNLPLATPTRCPTGTRSIGTSLAAGRPLRAMTISFSWPCSMDSTKRDKEDLACSIFTAGIAISTINSG